MARGLWCGGADLAVSATASGLHSSRVVVFHRLEPRLGDGIGGSLDQRSTVAATAWIAYGAVAGVLIAFINRYLPRSGTLVHPAQTASLPSLSLALKKN